MRKIVFGVVFLLAVLVGLRGKHSPSGLRPQPSVKPKTHRVAKNDVHWYERSVLSRAGTLVVENRFDHAALVKLISTASGRKVCVGLILPHSSLSIERIADDSYTLEYSLGDEIITGTEKLWNPFECRKIGSPIVFLTEKTTSETSEPHGKRSVKTYRTTTTQGTIHTVTLNAGSAGNTRSTAIASDEFDRL